MAFVEKAKEYIDAGVRVSKDVLSKAGAAAQEMGDKGVLKLEITQLETKCKKQYENLGSAVYKALIAEGEKSVTAKTDAVAVTLSEISRLQTLIDEKKAALNTVQPESK